MRFQCEPNALELVRTRQLRQRKEADVFGVITAVPAPVELQDAVHAELRRRTGGTVDGLVAHIGRATGDGFERYARDIVDPLVAELSHGQAPPAAESATPFEVRGVVIPAAGMFD